MEDGSGLDITDKIDKRVIGEVSSKTPRVPVSPSTKEIKERWLSEDEIESLNPLLREVLKNLKPGDLESNPSLVWSILGKTFTMHDLEVISKILPANAGLDLKEIEGMVKKREALLNDLKGKVYRLNEPVYIVETKAGDEAMFKPYSRHFFSHSPFLQNQKYDSWKDVLKPLRETPKYLRVALSSESNNTSKPSLRRSFIINGLKVVPEKLISDVDPVELGLTKDELYDLVHLAGADALISDYALTFVSSFKSEGLSLDDLKSRWDSFNSWFLKELLKLYGKGSDTPKEERAKRIASLFAKYWDGVRTLVDYVFAEKGVKDINIDYLDLVSELDEPLAETIALKKYLEDAGFKVNELAFAFRVLYQFLYGDVNMSPKSRELLERSLQAFKKLDKDGHGLLFKSLLLSDKVVDLAELSDRVKGLFEGLKEYRDRLPEVTDKAVFYRWAPEKVFAFFELSPSFTDKYIAEYIADKGKGWLAMGKGIYVAGNPISSRAYGTRINLVKLKRGAKMADITDRRFLKDVKEFFKKRSGFEFSDVFLEKKLIPFMADVTRYNARFDWYLIKAPSIIKDVYFDRSVLAKEFKEALEEEGLLNNPTDDRVMFHKELIYKVYHNLLEEEGKVSELVDALKYGLSYLKGEPKEDVFGRVRDWKKLSVQELRKMLDEIKEFFDRQKG